MTRDGTQFTEIGQLRALWYWLTRNGTVNPDESAPQVSVSGVADINLDSADDEVTVFGAEGSGSGTRRAINVDASGRVRSAVEDGQDVALGATTDAEATGNGSAVGVLKRLRTLLAGGLPSALTGSGNLKTALQESLPAGTNAIGKLAANDGVDVGDVTVNNTNGSPVPVSDAGGSLTVDGTVTANAGTGTRDVQGNVAHDDVDSGNPVKTGSKAVAHGSTPTQVAAGDRVDSLANRQGVPFVIGGVPNVQTVRANYTTAQTNAAIVSVSAGTKIVVTKVSAQTDEACTVGVQVRIGFGTSTTPTTTGVVLTHPGLVPGGAPVFEGNGSGIIGIGADDEDLRITSEVPTGGSLDVVVSYYTVAS